MSEKFKINYEAVKRKINEHTCSVHNQKAEIESIENDKINFKTCCKEFRTTILKVFKAELVKQTKTHLIKGFNGQ